MMIIIIIIIIIIGIIIIIFFGAFYFFWGCHMVDPTFAPATNCSADVISDNKDLERGVMIGFFGSG